MFSTYKTGDVTILLKDISGQVTSLSTIEREKAIQNGQHYCEMLPIEYMPSADYMKLFETGLAQYAKLTADATASLARQIMDAKDNQPVLVSLARAGTSIGVLIKRYIKARYGIDVPHYTISIIRGRGIDRNAMDYILERHTPQSIQFVDGWTGKGAIQSQLNEAMKDYPEVNPGLAVLSDPAGIAALRGTSDDFLIASCALNSTVSGLLSRTFLRSDVIGEKDFHGAAFYENLKDDDLTYTFIDTVASQFSMDGIVLNNEQPMQKGIEEVRSICKAFHISDINLVKPGIGEATRVLLRRVPERVLVRSLDDDEHLGHLYQLAKEKHVPLEIYPLSNYRACGIIRSMADS